MTAALYSPTLSYGYVYEDVARAPFVWDGWRAWMTMAVHAPARSLTRLLWHGLGQLTSYAPAWQHGASVFVHLVNGLLIWALARRLQFDSVAVTVATGVFLLHPVQLESVAYVSARTELLMTASVLIALWCVERGWVVPAFFSAASAVGGKEAGVVALALVPLWALWRGLPTWTPTVSMYWGVACWLLLLIALEWLRVQQLLWMPGDEVTRTLTAWTLLLGQWIVPTGLSIDPDWARLTPWPIRALAGAACGVAVGMLWQERVRWRTWPALIGLWVFLLVLPRLAWQLGEGLHVHHLYLATVVLSLATGRAFLHKDA